MPQVDVWVVKRDEGGEWEDGGKKERRDNILRHFTVTQMTLCK